MSALEIGEKDEMLRAGDQGLPELGTVIERRIRSLSVTELVEFLRLEGEDDVVDDDEAAAILRVLRSRCARRLFPGVFRTNGWERNGASQTARGP